MNKLQFAAVPEVVDDIFDGWHTVLVTGTIVNGEKTFNFTTKDLQHFATTRISNIAPFIDKNHEKDESYGSITEFRVKDDKLEAYIVWNKLGKEVRLNQSYKYFSPTIETMYDNVDKQEKTTITCVSLTNNPAIGQLGEITASKFNTKNKGVSNMEQPNMEMNQAVGNVSAMLDSMDDANKQAMMAALMDMMKKKGMNYNMDESKKEESDKGMPEEEKQKERYKFIDGLMSYFSNMFGKKGMEEKEDKEMESKDKDKEMNMSSTKKEFDAKTTNPEKESVLLAQLATLTLKFNALEKENKKLKEAETKTEKSAAFSAVQKAVNDGFIPGDKQSITTFTSLYESDKKQFDAILKTIKPDPNARQSVDGATVVQDNTEKEEKEYLKRLGVDLDANEKIITEAKA